MQIFRKPYKISRALLCWVLYFMCLIKSIRCWRIFWIVPRLSKTNRAKRTQSKAYFHRCNCYQMIDHHIFGTKDRWRHHHATRRWSGRFSIIPYRLQSHKSNDSSKWKMSMALCWRTISGNCNDSIRGHWSMCVTISTLEDIRLHRKSPRHRHSFRWQLRWQRHYFNWLKIEARVWCIHGRSSLFGFVFISAQSIKTVFRLALMYACVWVCVSGCVDVC